MYTSRWYQFTEHPESDSCWSLSTGPDGRIYAGASGRAGRRPAEM
jgi:hypothetical protein